MVADELRKEGKDLSEDRYEADAFCRGCEGCEYRMAGCNILKPGYCCGGEKISPESRQTLSNSDKTGIFGQYASMLSCWHNSIPLKRWEEF